MGIKKIQANECHPAVSDRSDPRGDYSGETAEVTDRAVEEKRRAPTIGARSRCGFAEEATNGSCA